MEARAKLSHLRMSPRKVKLVSDLICGLDTSQAEAQLKFINKKAAFPLLKLLKSAVANAVNNYKLDKNNLYIKRIIINEGPKLKRYRPRAMGRATEILKRSSNIDMLLAEKVESKAVKKEKKAAPAKEKKEDLKVVSRQELKAQQSAGKQTEKEEIHGGKKPASRFKQIRDRFIRRTGEK